MPRRFYPLNTFTRQARLRVLAEDGTPGPIGDGETVLGSIVAATSVDDAADAALADPSWRVTGTYIGTYTDDDGDVWGVYQFVIPGGDIDIDDFDDAFPSDTEIEAFFVVHLENSVHAMERLLATRGRLAQLG